MLNDPPRPEDLPGTPSEPYAALPPVYGPPPPVVARPADLSEPAAATGVPPGRRSPLVPVVAVGVVAALVLVAIFAVWRINTPSADRVALPTISRSAVATPTPTPSDSVPATPTPGPTSTDHPVELDAFYTQTISWRDCSDEPRHQCGSMRVPVDYAKPTGDTFTLALRKVPATEPSQKVGSLLINPGGPGGSGIEYAQYAQFVFSKEVREVYDIVGFDPRGIGESDAVTCLSDSDMDLLFDDDPTPDSAAERAKLLADAAAITSRCAASGGERARHMSTTEVARDMDVMRALVGDKRLNYFGVSYGTFLGALYADLFPQRVGRFVLDSAMSPNQTDLQEMDYDIQGFESSIDAFIDWCVKRPDCALGQDAAAAKGKIVALLDAVEKNGLTTSIRGLEKVGEGWVGFAIFMCLYSDTSWPTLNRGLTQAFTGKGDILVKKAMSVTSRSSTGSYADSSYLHAMIPVRCADWPRRVEDAALKAAQAKARADHPLWARMTGELYDNCKTWPGAGRAPKAGPIGVGAAPILVIGNERDPATPIGGTKQLAADLASGVLVTSDRDGHGTYYAGNPCVDAAVDDYLIQGKTPSDGQVC